MEKESPLIRCPTYDWRRINNYDSRYTSIGIISLYSLQESNGVYSAMKQALPELSNQGSLNFNDRESLSLRVMTRKRYRWQTNCLIPAQDYYDKLWSLRRYFYSIDEQKKFIEISN